jgi:hypothetical protein
LLRSYEALMGQTPGRRGVYEVWSGEMETVRWKAAKKVRVASELKWALLSVLRERARSCFAGTGVVRLGLTVPELGVEKGETRPKMAVHDEREDGYSFLFVEKFVEKSKKMKTGLPLLHICKCCVWCRWLINID